MLAYAAGQLGIDAGAFDDYARRDATRRSHLAEAMLAGGYATFDRAAAQTILRPGQLAGILVEELRCRRVLLAPPSWWKP